MWTFWTRTSCPRWTAPTRAGLDAAQLTGLLTELAPRRVGAQVTVYDPDLDPDGGYAALISDILVGGLAGLGTGLGRAASQVLAR